MAYVRVSLLLQISRGEDELLSTSTPSLDNVLKALKAGDRIYLDEILPLAVMQYPQRVSSLAGLRRFIRERFDSAALGKDPQGREFCVIEG